MGERITLDDPQGMWDEHRYRYQLAATYTRDSDIVVDAACGPGYGGTILHGIWIGVDKDVPTMMPPGGAFERANLQTWTAGFEPDVWVGLETIEHLEDFTHYVAQAKTAKRHIIISTPIIATKHANPWHVHDFTADEVLTLFRDEAWGLEQYETQDGIYGIWMFTRRA